MNQVELNRIAMNLIREHSDEVFVKPQNLLIDDVKERSEKISGPSLHHIHNAALFETLIWLNSFCSLGNKPSRKEVNGYLNFVGTLEPKFRDIIDALKDFQPTSKAEQEK